MSSLKKLGTAVALAIAIGSEGFAAPTIHDTPGAVKSSKPSGAASAKRKARKNRKRK